MSLNTWVETLVTQQGAGTSFGTYTTAKTVINAQALYTIPPGFWAIGKTLEIDVMGEISNLVTTPGTITMQVMMGSIVAFTTGAMQMSTTAHTALPFWLKVQVTCRAVGASTSANLMGQGVMFSRTVSVSGADVTGGHNFLMAPNTTPAVGTGFDSTIANILDFWSGFSISDAANVIRVSQYTVKSLN